MSPIAVQEILREISELRRQEVIYRQEANLMNIDPALKVKYLDLAQDCVHQRIDLEKLLAGGSTAGDKK